MSAGADFIARLLAAVPGSKAGTPVKDYPTVRLAAPADLLPAARLLKDELGFNYLEMVTAVDWLGPVDLRGYVSSPNPNPFTPKQPGPPVSPVPGPGAGRKEIRPAGTCGISDTAGVTYRPVLDLLWSFGDLVKNRKLFLRLEVPRDRAEAPSLTGLFPAADWQEREAFDLFGIRFAGHPNLIKILTPDFLQGHPLRKDYVHARDRYDEE